MALFLSSLQDKVASSCFTHQVNSPELSKGTIIKGLSKKYCPIGEYLGLTGTKEEFNYSAIGMKGPPWHWLGLWREQLWSLSFWNLHFG